MDEIKYCKCGCGKVITSVYWVRQQKIVPNFIQGHHMKNSTKHFKLFDMNPYPCACGCGQLIVQRYSWYRTRFIHNHHPVRERTKEERMVAGRKASSTIKEHGGRVGTRNGHFGKKQKLSTKQTIRQMKQKLWEDDLWVKKWLKSHNLKPNRAEKLLEALLNEICPNEYKYVGDGEFVIGRKCPDFVNTNGQKKFIELFGDYWHKGENPQNRIDTFKKFGYATLVIWENELGDKEKLKRKILAFHNKQVELLVVL